MTPVRKFVLAGAALLAVGCAGAVAAANYHVLNVRLPDGTLEQIRYIGATPPTVSFASGPAEVVAFADPFTSAQSPFAAMDRISAEMDQQAARMLEEARAMPMGPMTEVDLGRMPAGASGYTMVSTFSGGHMCTRTTEYSSSANGAPPKILTKSSGCDAAAAPAGPRSVSTAPTLPGAASHAGGMTQVRYVGRPTAGGEGLALSPGY